MSKSDSPNTTSPSGEPTPAEMYEMWLALRLADEDADTLRDYAQYRRSTMTMLFGEAA